MLRTGAAARHHQTAGQLHLTPVSLFGVELFDLVMDRKPPSVLLDLSVLPLSLEFILRVEIAAAHLQCGSNFRSKAKMCFVFESLQIFANTASHRTVGSSFAILLI